MATSKITYKPFVVESGTTDIWTYRKWSDGTAECWGIKGVANVAISTAYGYAYYSGEINTSFPSGLFTTTPSVNVTSADVAGYGTWFNVTTNGTSKTKVRGLMYATTSITTPVNLALHAIGKWK